MACGIFLDQGLNLLLHWQVDSLPLNHQGSPKLDFISKKSCDMIQQQKQKTI